MGKLKKIPKGSLLTITSGAYSSYCVQGVFRALDTIDAELLRSEWLEAHPEQSEPYKFDEPGFLADIARRALLEPVDCWELHLCDYASADDMDVSKIANQ